MKPTPGLFTLLSLIPRSIHELISRYLLSAELSAEFYSTLPLVKIHAWWCFETSISWSNAKATVR